MTAPTDAPQVRDRFPALDAVRALGALGVVATHVAFQTGRSVNGPLSGSLARLDSGVALFFVLSGFLLFRPWVVAAWTGGPVTPTRVYLRRRALRILPAYWAVVVVSLTVLPSNAGHRGPEVWLRHLTLTQIYGHAWGRFGLTQTWSLCTEVAFYLVLPLLAPVLVRGLRRRRPAQSIAALLLLAAVSPVWNVLALHGHLDRWDGAQWLPAQLDWFAGGMVLAVAQTLLAAGAYSPLLERVRAVAASPSTCWWAALAVFVLATSPIAGPRSLEAVPTAWQAVTKNLLYLVFAVLLVLPLALRAKGHSGLEQVLQSRPLHRLGMISYGIFLWHLLLLAAVVDLRGQGLFTGSWTTTYLLTTLVTVAAATASYFMIERPFMRRSGSKTTPRAEIATEQRLASRPLEPT